MDAQEHNCGGCQEFRELSRRGFFSSSRLAFGALVTAPVWLPRVVFARDGVSNRDTLVSVFLRGGADGLSVVTPYGDPYLTAPTPEFPNGLRPNLFLGPPDHGQWPSLDLDGFFGLTPAMADLVSPEGPFATGDLAFVHATGANDPNRSHFTGYQIMEYGTPNQPLTLFTGWLARYLQVTPAAQQGPLRAAAIGTLLPRTLEGAPQALPIPELTDFSLPGDAATSSLREAIMTASYAAAGEPMASTVPTILETIDLLDGVQLRTPADALYFYNQAGPPNGASFGAPMARAFRYAAELIRLDIGVEAVTLDVGGGWDTHASQQNRLPGGPMYRLMYTLGKCLMGFYKDLQGGPYAGGVAPGVLHRTTAFCFSEFGRVCHENGNGNAATAGCDHGHGNCAMVFGGHVNGGQVIADWKHPDDPNSGGQLLRPDLLYGDPAFPSSPRNALQVTTDYRSVLWEILERRAQASPTHLEYVFPDFTPPPHPGVILP